MEMEKIPEAGYKIIGLTIAGYNRSSLIRNITLPLKLVQSFFNPALANRRFDLSSTGASRPGRACLPEHALRRAGPSYRLAGHSTRRSFAV